VLPRLLRALVLLAGVAVAGLAGLWFLQRRLLYFPVRYERAPAEREARALGLEAWTGDGGTLLGWVHRTPGARGRLVVFHGNAGSALDRTYFVAALARAAPALPLDVYLAEYPGYGPCPGAPSEPAILASARAQLAAARRIGTGPLLVAGESLGSAVAALAAADSGAAVDGVLLVTPLASVPAVASRHYPFAPSFVHRDAWRSDRALPRWRGRLAVIVAGRDEVVFPDLGRALYDAFAGPKRLWVDEAATHNSVDWRPDLPRWREIVELLAGAG
jgi:pimeloyl-ACP methyl ester carboxylesterase